MSTQTSTTDTPTGVETPSRAHTDLVHQLRAAALHDVQQPIDRDTGARAHAHLPDITGPGDARATPHLRAAASEVVGATITGTKGMAPGDYYPPNNAKVRATLKRWAIQHHAHTDR